MKKSGFTLAEVLITLVIIGVIAALTLGTVISNSSKKQLESQIKKFHAQFANAIQLYMADNNVENLDDVRDNFDINEFVYNYLKVTTKCSEGPNSCFADEYIITPGEDPAENPLPRTGGDYIGYKLADGSAFEIILSWVSGESGFAYISFDVNGPKKPNKAGQDLWVFYIHSDGSIDGKEITPEVKRSSSASEINDLVNQGYQDNCPENAYASCFAYLIRNDYKIVD